MTPPITPTPTNLYRVTTRKANGQPGTMEWFIVSSYLDPAKAAALEANEALGLDYSVFLAIEIIACTDPDAARHMLVVKP